ncbi:hypothetical protein AWJ24_12015 [Escherichia coli]|nr:hypothetical protein AWJ24_12015 [Escherichia coli]OKV98269.1 hypothetical protein AWP68_21285 [Escherichia coli]
MMSLWDALRMNMMISYQELVRTFLRRGRYRKTPRNTPFVLPEPEPFENNIIIDAIFTCNLCNTSSRL